MPNGSTTQLHRVNYCSSSRSDVNSKVDGGPSGAAPLAAFITANHRAFQKARAVVPKQMAPQRADPADRSRPGCRTGDLARQSINPSACPSSQAAPRYKSTPQVSRCWIVSSRSLSERPRRLCIAAKYSRLCRFRVPNATSHSSSTSRTHRQSGLYPVVISYSEERNTKTATVKATPTPTPRPAPIATPTPILATAAPTPVPSTTPTNTLNGKAATPQREIFVPWLRFFPLTVIVPDTGLTRQYQVIRLVSFKPWRNAARRCSMLSGDVLRRNPTTGIAGCCAHASSGHIAAPVRGVMNSRRLS